MKNNIINFEIVRKAKEIAIDNYKELISKEYSKKGINYSGNIFDLIEKVQIKQNNNYYLIIINGGDYKDYFGGEKNYKICLIYIFNQEGKLIYKRDSIPQNEKSIGITNNNNIYIFKKNNTVVHYNCNKENPTKTIINNIKGKKLYLTNYSSSIIGLKTINDEYLLYNQDNNSELFTCNDITDEYEEYPHIPKNLLLVKKRVIYKNLYSDIEFFIDKSGNIISKIIDCTYGVTHNNYKNAGNDFTFNIVKLYLKQKLEEQKITNVRIKNIKRNLT